MNQQKHIIHRVNVEVDVSDVGVARRLYNNLGECLQSAVLPAIEAELNRVIAADKHYRTDSLTIDVCIDAGEELEITLGQQVSKNLNAGLGELLSKEHLFETGNNNSILKNLENQDKVFLQKSAAEKRWEVFIDFLKTGRLPWYAGSGNQLDEELLIIDLDTDANSNIELFTKVLDKHLVAKQRLVKQFSRSFVLALLEKPFAIPISHYLMKIDDALLNEGIERKRQVQEEFILKVLTLISTNHVSTVTIETQLEEDVTAATFSITKKDSRNERAAPIKTEEKLEPQKKKKVISFEEDGFYVQNAGLVLLHPFLQYFLIEFDLMQENQFKDEAAQQVAIHLLHYLATGKEQSYEYDLQFEKYFCGFPLGDPLDRFISLTDKMKEESNNLLTAAIHHWKVLKSTSAGGLREGFLQRSGKLILSPHQHRLIVETNTIDILLDQLPWNYSIIQLPWMQQILYVDWITS